MDGSKRKFFLKEQLKAIQKELGLEKDDKTSDVDKFKEKFEDFINENSKKDNISLKEIYDDFIKSHSMEIEKYIKNLTDSLNKKMSDFEKMRGSDPGFKIQKVPFENINRSRDFQKDLSFFFYRGACVAHIHYTDPQIISEHRLNEYK